MISSIGTWVAAIAAGVAAFVAKSTLEESKKDQKRGLIRTKKQATIDAYEILQKESFDRINAFLPSEIKTICENKQSSEYKELSGYLAGIERFCVGLNEDIYDYDTFYKIAHGYFDGEKGMLRNRLLPLLESKLECADEDYFENIHEVWKKMNERK